MDRTITIIHLFPIPQINNSEIVWEANWILIKAKSKTKHIIKALLKAAVVGERLFIFSHDGVIAFEARTYQIFLNECINVSCSVSRDIIENQVDWCCAQRNLFQALPKR